MIKNKIRSMPELHGNCYLTKMRRFPVSYKILLMDAEELKSYTFNQLVQLYKTDDDVLFDGCMVMHRIAQFPVHIPICQADVYIGIFCREGEMTVTANLKEYVVRKNSLFIYLPNSIVSVDCQAGCTVDCVMMASDFFYKHHFYLEQMISVVLQVRHAPLIQLSDNESESYDSMLNCIRSTMKVTDHSSFSKEAVRGSIGTLFYSVCRQIGSKGMLPQYGGFTQNRTEEYFCRFMQVLSQSYKAERRVEFYASKLCISPKYLSALIKEVSGKRPSEWIEELVMLEAQNLLRYSKITVKEIADQLNFPNSSFFGIYFKRHTGLSPKNYRIKGI